MKTPVFQDIRTRRLKITLKELEIGQAIALVRLPPEANELSLNTFLKYAVQESVGVDYVSDWTVQERYLTLCQYISASSEHPDFELNNNNHYSDYLFAEKDVDLDANSVLQPFELGEIAGDTWRMQYLTGGMAEAIERLLGEVKYPNGDNLSGYAHWELGCMAAQLMTDNNEALNQLSEGQLDERMVHRMQVFLAFPQSIYIQLRAAFYIGWDQQSHLFKLGLSDSGLVVLPKEVGSKIPPARFRLRSILSTTAQNLAG
jgi:hypothetical protein